MPAKSRGERGRALLTLGVAFVLAGCGGPAARTASTGRAVSNAPVSTVASQTTQALRLPGVGTAQLAACEQDFQTLRMAEYTYQLVNDGRYASMTELIDGQYIGSVPTFYVAVRIGVPVDGFTLVASPSGPCVSLPVRDRR